MQWYLRSCKFPWVFYPTQRVNDAVVEIQTSHHITSYHINHIISHQSHHRATLSVPGLSRAHRSLPASHTERVQAGESLLKAGFYPSDLLVQPHQLRLLSTDPLSILQSFSCGKHCRGNPPLVVKRSHFLRGCPFFTHQKVESSNTKGMW